MSRRAKGARRARETETCNEAARLFSVLSGPARLEILLALSKKGGCVSVLQLATGRPQPNVSQHLRVLRDCGLVAARREGRKICYSLADRRLSRLFSLAKNLGGEHGRRTESDSILDADVPLLRHGKAIPFAKGRGVRGC